MIRNKTDKTLNSNVREFFKFDEDAKKNKCLVFGCCGELSGASNSITCLKQHLIRVHPKIAEELQLPNLKATRKASNNHSPSVVTLDDSSLDSTASFNAVNEVLSTGTGDDDQPQSKRQKITEYHAVEGCISLSVEQNEPIQGLNSKDEFQMVTATIADAAETEIDTTSLLANISSAAQEIRQMFAEKLKHRLFSIKVDAVKNLKCRLLVINAQTLVHSDIEVFTLGVIDVTRNVKADYLKAKFEELLEQVYGLSTLQVYSVTTDSGAHAVKFVNLFEEESMEKIDFEEISDSHSEFYVDVAEHLELGIKPTVLSFDNCVAVTLHDIMIGITTKYETPIKIVREYVRRLKSHEFHDIYESSGTPRPFLDVETQWMSTYLMMKNLLDNMEFYKDPSFLVPLPAEHFIFKFVAAITPLYSAAKRCQEEQLIMGE
jgi:hypothetical protein